MPGAAAPPPVTVITKMLESVLPLFTPCPGTLPADGNAKAKEKLLGVGDKSCCAGIVVAPTFTATMPLKPEPVTVTITAFGPAGSVEGLPVVIDGVRPRRLKPAVFWNFCAR